MVGLVEVEIEVEIEVEMRVSRTERRVCSGQAKCTRGGVYNRLCRRESLERLDHHTKMLIASHQLNGGVV
jgi:hypothetical protein